MLPARAPDWLVYRGDYPQTCTLRFSAAGQPLDLSDCDLAAQWRPDPDSTSALALDVEASQAGQGQIIVAIGAEIAPDIDNGQWDLQATKDTAITTLIRGNIIVIKDVTHA